MYSVFGPLSRRINGLKSLNSKWVRAFSTRKHKHRHHHHHKHNNEIEFIKPTTDVSNNQLFIGGKFVDSLSGRTLPVIDPRNGDEIVAVSNAQGEDVDLAVKSARTAFDSGVWSAISGYERGKIMNKLADKIAENFGTLQELETWNGGKPMAFSQIDVFYTEECFRYFAGWADKIGGETIACNNVPFEKFAYTLKEPLGVVGAIVPWNFPLLIAAWYLAPALACGNTVVLKTSQHTPLSTLYLGKLMQEAGIPEGVVNILPGTGSITGESISLHPDINKIGFTGSTEVGKRIMTNAAQNIVPVTLELGGKSPMIVFEDADLTTAIESCQLGMFLNQGQVCSASSRIYVQESIYDEFIEKSIERTKAKQIGDPFVGTIDHGPQQNEKQYKTVLNYINIGKEEGANLIYGGEKLYNNDGYYVQPTIFSDVEDSMKISREEIFGPVMAISPFKTTDEVIQRANDTSYGLGAGICSNNTHTIKQVSRGLKAGTVWVNCYNMIDSAVPFGGYKQSGFGRVKGKESLHNFYQTKLVMEAMPNNGGWY